MSIVFLKKFFPEKKQVDFSKKDIWKKLFRFSIPKTLETIDFTGFRVCLICGKKQILILAKNDNYTCQKKFVLDATNKFLNVLNILTILEPWIEIFR